MSWCGSMPPTGGLHKVEPTLQVNVALSGHLLFVILFQRSQTFLHVLTSMFAVTAHCLFVFNVQFGDESGSSNGYSRYCDVRHNTQKRPWEAYHLHITPPGIMLVLFSCLTSQLLGAGTGGLLFLLCTMHL